MSDTIRTFGPQAGRPLLALHCSLAHGGAWDPLARALPAQRIVAPDLLGHGAMPLWSGDGDFALQSLDMVTALADDLAARNGGPIDLIGHSFGGVMALALAQRRPALIRSLCLIEPVIFAAAKATAPDVFTNGMRAFAAVGEDFAHGDPTAAAEKFLDLWGGGLPFAVQPKRQQEYAVQRMNIVVAPQRVLADDGMGLLAAGALEAMALPVLLVEGGKSPALVAAINAHLLARLPDVTHLVVDKAAHMLPLTHPQMLAPALGAHLCQGCLVD